MSSMSWGALADQCLDGIRAALPCRLQRSHELCHVEIEMANAARRLGAAHQFCAALLRQADPGASLVLGLDAQRRQRPRRRHHHDRQGLSDTSASPCF
jgi:hypothetical protein